MLEIKVRCNLCRKDRKAKKAKKCYVEPSTYLWLP